MRAKIFLAAISATGLALIYSLNAASAENPMKAGTLCHGLASPTDKNAQSLSRGDAD